MILAPILLLVLIGLFLAHLRFSFPGGDASPRCPICWIGRACGTGKVGHLRRDALTTRTRRRAVRSRWGRFAEASDEKVGGSGTNRNPLFSEKPFLYPQNVTNGYPEPVYSKMAVFSVFSVVKLGKTSRVLPVVAFTILPMRAE